jgi:hypothetical protein
MAKSERGKSIKLRYKSHRASVDAKLPSRIGVEVCSICGEPSFTLQKGTYNGFSLLGCVHLKARKLIAELRERLKIARMAPPLKARKRSSPGRAKA